MCQTQHPRGHRCDCLQQHTHSTQVSPAHSCTCEHTAQLHTCVNTLHSFPCTHTSLLLPFWYQGRNQGQGTLAVLLGIVSGQHENLSKVRLQTSSAEGQELVALWPHPLSTGPSVLSPHTAGTLCWLLCPIPIPPEPHWAPHRH